MIFSPFGMTCLWKCLYPLTVFFLPFLFLFLLLFFFLFSRLIHCRVTNPAKLKLREKTNERKKQERKLWRNVRQGKKQVVIIILYGTNVEENND